jgi:predicted GIY-YIG superfamily endonuclease
MIYLLHFSRPYKTRRKSVRHYMGTTQNLRARIADHRNGRGARLLAAVVKRGIKVTVVQTWRGSFATEQKLKSGKNLPKLCPICRK